MKPDEITVIPDNEMLTILPTTQEAFLEIPEGHPILKKISEQGGCCMDVFYDFTEMAIHESIKTGEKTYIGDHKDKKVYILVE